MCTDEVTMYLGRFRIIGGGGQGLEYWGPRGGGKFPAGT